MRNHATSKSRDMSSVDNLRFIQNVPFAAENNQKKAMVPEEREGLVAKFLEW